MVKGVAVARIKVRSTFDVNFAVADGILVGLEGICGGRSPHVAGTWKGRIGSERWGEDGQFVKVVNYDVICSTRFETQHHPFTTSVESNLKHRQATLPARAHTEPPPCFPPPTPSPRPSPASFSSLEAKKICERTGYLSRYTVPTAKRTVPTTKIPKSIGV